MHKYLITFAALALVCGCSTSRSSKEPVELAPYEIDAPPKDEWPLCVIESISKATRIDGRLLHAVDFRILATGSRHYVRLMPMTEAERHARVGSRVYLKLPIALVDLHKLKTAGFVVDPLSIEFSKIFAVTNGQ